MTRFYTISLGPIMYETRFLQLLENNQDTLSNFLWIVDDFDTYARHSNSVRLIDVHEYRKNHYWSQEKEHLFSEKDKVIFCKDFKKYCFNQKKFYPLDLQRAAFPYFYENNTLNFSFIASNVKITNNQNIIDEYFQKVPKGSFLAPLFFPTSPRPYYLAEYIQKDLQALYPSIKIPDTYYYFDGQMYSFHFHSKEDLLLFYNIWDDVLRLYYENENIAGLLGTSAGYTVYEGVVGYVMNIFCQNFEYKLEYIIDYWDQHKLGKHISHMHDTFMYASGVRNSWVDLGVVINENTNSVKDFIAQNQKPLKDFYRQYENLFDITITEDEVKIKYKGSI